LCEYADRRDNRTRRAGDESRHVIAETHRRGLVAPVLPTLERKARLQRLFRKEIDGLRYSENVAARAL
jgi:hypothetical protein